MPNKAFVIGDVHGCLEQLQQLLKYWNPDSEKLFFVGDLIDRGTNSRAVVQLALKLHNKYGAVVIGGNHEKMFVEWLDAPIMYMNDLYRFGGKTTLHSFLGKDRVNTHSPRQLSKQLLQDFPQEIAFLRSLPDYSEYGNYIIVHAGVDLSLHNWKNSSSYHFRSIRKPFHEGKNKTGRIIVFGHTPTRRLHPDKRNDIWISPCETKIGIDGGAVFGGMLHGLHIKGDGKYGLHSVDSKQKVHEKLFSLDTTVL